MNLKIFVRKVIRSLSKTIRKNPDFIAKNKKKKIKQCYICGEQFEEFYKYRINNEASKAIDYFQMVGSDPENFGCYYCNCSDRDRHLFMFFDKINLWDKFLNASILHFAPEYPLLSKIEQINPKQYIKCDLFPKDDWEKVDIAKIPYNDDSFDVIICNHVLEHIPDHLKAIAELSRVLKPEGVAILQTPYSELLYNHFEDRNINTDALRLTFYGQEDHLKVLSKRAFFEELSQFFNLYILKHQDLFAVNESFIYGVNNKEDLVMVTNKKSVL